MLTISIYKYIAYIIKNNIRDFRQLMEGCIVKNSLADFNYENCG